MNVSLLAVKPYIENDVNMNETFGSIIDRLMAGRPLTKLSKESDISYPHLNALTHGRKGDKEIRPTTEIIARVVEAFEILGIHVRDEDYDALLATTTNLPQGYRVVRESPAPYETQYQSDPNIARIVESYTNAKGPVKQMFELAASMVTDEDGNVISVEDALSRAAHEGTTHGKRAE